MQIQIQTDNHVPHDPSVVAHVEKTCTAQLAHFASDITRVEVHLRDENGQRGGAADRTCSIERTSPACRRSRPPIAPKRRPLP